MIPHGAPASSVHSCSPQKTNQWSSGGHKHYKSSLVSPAAQSPTSIGPLAFAFLWWPSWLRIGSGTTGLSENLLKALTIIHDLYTHLLYTKYWFGWLAMAIGKKHLLLLKNTFFNKSVELRNAKASKISLDGGDIDYNKIKWDEDCEQCCSTLVQVAWTDILIWCQLNKCLGK